MCQTETGMSRPSQREKSYVQTIVRLPDFRAFMTKILCVHQTLDHLPDFHSFMSRNFYVLLCVHVQIFERSPDFRALNRLSCMHVQTLVCFPDFRGFMPIIYCVLSPEFRAFTRLSCVQQTFVCYPCAEFVLSRWDFRAVNARIWCVPSKTNCNNT